MSGRAKALIGGLVIVVAVVAFFILTGRGGPLPGIGLEECPLTGREPSTDAVVDRPAVAIKVENNPVAYPLSGLQKADVVYEELVEGRITRFLAIYHCTDARKVGPVRSARVIDAAIVSPYTRILGAAGGNAIVRRALEDGEIVLIDESDAGSAMRRIERPGITSEHTLYANSAGIRRKGQDRFDDLPGDEIFEFGDLEGRARRARTVTIDFGGPRSVSYRWSGKKWLRFDGGEPLVVENGRRIAVDNVLIEQHTINESEEVSDVLGTPSIEIANVTGSGRALLFRNGRVIVGRWTRASEDEPVVFETRTGDRMVLAPGKVWIELVPDNKGDVKGSVTHER